MKTKQELLIEIEELRNRLEEAEETLRAIRSGEVDGLVVSTPEGEQVFTLAGADYPYRVLIEEMSEGAFTMAFDGTILYCNSRFAEMIKKPLEKVINSSFFQLIEPENRETIYAMIRGEGGEKVRSEINLRAGSRSTVPVYFSVNFMETGDTRTICGVVTDLTEQKRSEEILKAAKLANSILDQSTEAIIICDENGRIIQTSREAHRYFPGKLLRQPFDSVSRLSIASSLPSQPKQFSISSVLSGKIIRSLEVTHRRDDTKESYFLLSARPLTHNGKGILGCVVSLTDITERKQMEGALRESEGRYRMLVETAPDAVVVHRDNRFLYANSAALNLYGADTFEQLSAHSISDLLHSNEREPVAERTQLVMSGEKTPLRETRILRLDRQEVPVEATAAPITYQGTRAVQVILRDITERKQAEEALHQERDRLAALVNSIRDEIWFADATGQFTLVNPSGSREFNLDADATADVCQLAATLEVLRPDGTPRPIEETPPLRALSGEVVTNQEELIRTPATGELRYRQVSAAPVRDGSGNIIGSVSVVRDITDRKKVEETLQVARAEVLNEKNRLEALMEALPIGVALTDVQGGNVRSNKAYEQVWGVPRPEVRSVSDYTPYKAWWPETGKPVAPEEWASAQVVQKGQAMVGQLLEIQRFDGSRASVINSGAPIFDAAGKIDGCAVAIQDITDLRKAQEALRQSEERLRRVVETSQIGIGFGDSTGRVFEANESFFRITGYSRKEILDGGIGWERLTAPEYADIDRLVMEQVSATGVAGPYEKEYIRKGGSRIPILVSAARLSTEPDEHVAFIVDLTERKQMEEELRRSRDELEIRVQERTVELTSVVAALQDEMAERKRAQEAVEAERQRFNDVLEILPAYLVLLSPDYHVPFANRFFRERFGESHGKRCFEHLFGRSEPCETCESYTALKTMLPHRWEWTGPDGRIYDVSDFPFTDTDGSTLILEMGIDITERKQAQEALRAASLYTRNLIEASLDPLVTISADGKIMDVNSATELTTGVPRDELIGTDFSDYFTDPEKAREGYQRVFREGFVRDYPLAIRHTSNKVTDVLYHATVFRNENGVVLGVFAAARDITARRRAEEALRESENRLRLLSSQLINVQEAERKRIAREVHDSIGQTLAAIKFGLESKLSQMSGGVTPPGVSIENIISLTQNGIEESRRIQMDLRPSVLDDLGILATIGWFTREFQKVYVHISVEKHISVEENEIPDSLRTVLFRVMQEAMNNIAKHSKADLARLTLRRTLDKIELSIKDNGAGFDLESIRQGLGLTSMRERTELSGGSFEVESAPGTGTIIKASWTT